jgi:hypothetical protein
MKHLLVCIFAALNLSNESSSSFSEIAQTIRDEAFPPKMLLQICSTWPLPGTDADKHANVATRPFVDNSLVQGKW